MKEPNHSHARTAEPPPAGISIDDLLYIFFRHKWKILIIFLMGMAGAAGVYFLTPASYQSQARIFIKYVTETRGVPNLGGNIPSETVKNPDTMGKNIINSEMDIITSRDLAQLVAAEVTPEKILARVGGGSNLTIATTVIQKGLKVSVPDNSSVVRLEFYHPDSSVVQPVLSEIVKNYQARHRAIHQGVGYLADTFSREADNSRGRLADIEDKLEKLKTEGQILSLEQDRTAMIANRNRLETDFSAAETELAEQTAMLNTWESLQPGKPVEISPDTTNSAPPIPADIADQYRTLGTELEGHQKLLTEYKRRWAAEHPQVKSVSQDIARVQEERLKLEAQYTNINSVVPTPVTMVATSSGVDLNGQKIRVKALETKMLMLSNKLAAIRVDTGKMIKVEPQIVTLEQQKRVEEAKLNYYSASLERARSDESSGPGKITGIEPVESPTPPSRDTKKMMKPLGAMMFLGLFGGIGVAFILERFLDKRPKRVVDLERLLNLPVFVSVPDFAWRGTQKNLAKALAQAASDGAAAEAANGSEKSLIKRDPKSIAPWDSRHVLRSYYEGLRDRLITYFEVRNLTHKPKLVAVTSCKHGAGVTSMAAGLAATLSETGDGNVLLVDMNLERGAAHQFYQGKPGCGLSDALENATRDPAQVQENLYLVSAHESKNDKLPRVLPKRFAHLIPRMKASDYDYIIFDMPPITQTSVTPRLAGFMDMVLVVVESETTGQEIVKRAHSLLSDSRATVATVLNKHRAYIPERFSQEL